jgi:DNA-binding transcriptional MocR family regulator
MVNDSSSRIVEELRAWIATAAPGAQLPSTRSLVVRHEASPVTVQKALRTLVGQGLVESRPGVGTFVRERRPAKPADYGWQTAALGSRPSGATSTPVALRSVTGEVIALQSGYPDPALLPERLVRGAFTRVARRDVTVNRAPAAGLPELQAWFAAELNPYVADGHPTPSAGDVVITPGSQSGLGAVFASLVEPGDTLLVESPTYWGAMLAAKRAGVRLHPVASGPHGPDADDVERALRETGARAFYAQPNFANPTGVQWSAALREQVLDLVRAHGAFLVEDDWAHDFGISSHAVPVASADDDGHVVYVRSLTKSLSPAVRVAAVIARGPVRERILRITEAESMYVSPVLQAVALDVVTQPAWRSHLRSLSDGLRMRRDALADALSARGIDAIRPPGGLNLWVRLPDRVDEEQLVRDCELAGLVLSGGREWFPAEPAGPHVRLTFSSGPPSRFADAAAILAAQLAKQAG